MTSQREGSLKRLLDLRTDPRVAIPSVMFTTRLGLKWEAPQDETHDSLQFLRRSRDSSHMCTASSKFYIDLAADIWDLNTLEIVQRIPAPGTMISCMDWLGLGYAFVTGGHDNGLVLWREGERVGQVLAHNDWVRTVGINSTDSIVASGDIKSTLALWDLPSFRRISITPFPQYMDLNALMSTEFHPLHPHLLYVFQRSGHMSVCDIRTAEMTQVHFLCHNSRGSGLKVCNSMERVVTSARGSEIKMWDIRKIQGSEAYVQIYNKHESEKLALGFDLVLDERVLVTGSDSFYAYVYDLLTGQLLETIKLAEGSVVSTVGTSPSTFSFLCLHRSGQSLGLVDTSGPSILHKFSSSEQIKAMYSQWAWEKAIIHNADRVLSIGRTVQTDIPVNYDHILEVVRASQLPICKTLIKDLEMEYDVYMKECTPRLVRDLQEFYEKQSSKKTPVDTEMRRNTRNTEGSREVAPVRREISAVCRHEGRKYA